MRAGYVTRTVKASIDRPLKCRFPINGPGGTWDFYHDAYILDPSDNILQHASGTTCSRRRAEGNVSTTLIDPFTAGTYTCRIYWIASSVATGDISIPVSGANMFVSP